MKIHAPHSRNRLRRKIVTLLLSAAVVGALFATPRTSLGAGPQPVAIYRVVTQSNLTSFGPDRHNRVALRQDYFLILDLNSLRYRTVNLLPNRKYRADDVTQDFSQAFASVDAANRARLVLSIAGPGSKWQVTNGADFKSCMTDTATGLIRNLWTRGIDRRFQIQAPTVLRGQGRYESADLDDDDREIETTQTVLRYHTILTDLSNSRGGGTAGGQDDVVGFLRERGWVNLFGDDNVNIIN